MKKIFKMNYEDLARKYIENTEGMDTNNKVYILVDLMKHIHLEIEKDKLHKKLNELNKIVDEKKKEIEQFEGNLKWYKENYVEKHIVVDAIYKYWYKHPDLTLLIEELNRNNIEILPHVIEQEIKYQLKKFLIRNKSFGFDIDKYLKKLKVFGIENE